MCQVDNHHATERSITNKRYNARSPADIARTICDTLGITREMVERLRVSGNYWKGDPALPNYTAPHAAADALTALLDLAEDV